MGALPIQHVMRARRLIYLQTKLKMHDSEVTRWVFMSQKSKQLPGEWCLKAKEDFEKVGVTMEDKVIEEMSETDSL